MSSISILHTDTAWLAYRPVDISICSVIDACVERICGNGHGNRGTTTTGGIRTVRFYSDSVYRYPYGRIAYLATPLDDVFRTLLDYVNYVYDSSYSGLLVNEYVGQYDYISPHSDDVRGIDEKAGVVIVSWGAARIFRIRENTGRMPVVCDHLLEPYTMIQMGGTFQRDFMHEIPISDGDIGRRISFTFRR